MASIAPANFAYVNANGDKGDVQVLSDADITLLNEGLQDIEDLKLAIQKPLPAGTIIPFAGTSTVPDNFLLCNGALISRTDYASLFAVIGTAYGAGDGSNTFALPDYRDRVLQGASASHAAGTYIAAGLPDILGYSAGNAIMSEWMYKDLSGFLSTFSGAVYASAIPTTTFSVGEQANRLQWQMLFAASKSNDLYGASSTVQPLAGTVQYLIKY